MKVIPLIGTILDRHKTDNARGIADKVAAVIDYNVMMGILEDPDVGEEPEEVEEFDEVEEEEDDNG